MVDLWDDVSFHSKILTKNKHTCIHRYTHMQGVGGVRLKRDRIKEPRTQDYSDALKHKNIPPRL